MNDRFDLVPLHDAAHQLAVAGLAVDQWHVLRDRPAKAGREIVDHHHPLAGIDQRVDHVAADITGTAGDEDGHCNGLLDVVMGDVLPYRGEQNLMGRS